MWKPVIPAELIAAIDDKEIYDAFGSYLHLPKFPAYVEGSFYYPDECVVALKEVPLGLIADALWCAMEDGHERWLDKSAVRALMYTEECANCLNVFAKDFAMVGAEFYNIQAKRAQRMFLPLGISFYQSLNTTGFEHIMTQLEDHDFSQTPLMNSIFAVNRRAFAENAKIAGKGDLFRYLLARYGGIEDENYLFRQAGQIIRANGGLAPVEW